MKIKILAIGLSLLFFGSISTPTFGMVIQSQHTVTLVDNDKTPKNHKKMHSKKECASQKECTSKKECCSSAKSCDTKKGGGKK